MHDFLIPAQGKAIPYGVYDLACNEGWVSVGIDHDTAEFALRERPVEVQSDETLACTHGARRTHVGGAEKRSRDLRLLAGRDHRVLRGIRETIARVSDDEPIARGAAHDAAAAERTDRQRVG